MNGREVLRLLVPLLTAAGALVLVLGATTAQASVLAVEPDGSILLGGYAFPGFAAVARFAPDGGLDPSFGKGGAVIDRQLPTLSALALQPGRGIVIGATKRGTGPFLGRLRLDGSTDESFGGDGTLGVPHEATGVTPVAIVSGVEGNRIAVALNTSIDKFMMWPRVASVERLSADGVREGIFGRLPELSASLSDAAVMSDGSLVGVGSQIRRFVPGSGSEFDPAFGAGEGLATLPGDEYRAEAVAADGPGFVTVGFGHGVEVARYDAGGVLDPGFGQAGATVVAPPTGLELRLPWFPLSLFSVHALGVAVQADGRILVVASLSPPPVDVFNPKPCTACARAEVIRLMPDGTLDPSFGEGGAVLIGGGAATFYGTNLKVLGDGKILVAGVTDDGSHGMVLARLTAEGSLDPSFGAGGIVTEHPCGETEAERVRARCAPRARVRLEVSRLRSRKPSLWLRVRPSLAWSQVESVEVKLPPALRLHPKFAARQERVIGRVPRLVKAVVRPGSVSFPYVHRRALTVKMRDGAFNAVKRLGRHHRLVFRIVVRFGIESGDQSKQTVVVERRP